MRKKVLALRKVWNCMFCGMLLYVFPMDLSQATPLDGEERLNLAERLRNDKFDAPDHLLAVDVTVTGTVVDEAGEPIPGVTVSVSGTTTGTATDLNGNYSLTVPEGSSLVFSFIGFVTQTVAIGDRTVEDVVLSEDVQSLEEVVVVGYGVQKKTNLIGS